MPSFIFTSPEGKKYTVNGPEGATKDQAWGILQQQLGMTAPEEKTEDKPEEKQSFLRSVADIPLSVQSGYTNTIRSQLGTFGMAGDRKSVV